MNKKRFAIGLIVLIMIACLAACGFYAVKSIRKSNRYQAAMAAYESKEWADARSKLRAYTREDPDKEAAYAALAEVNHHFDDYGDEAACWQRASALNPLNAEYVKKMLDAAFLARNFGAVYSILGRRVSLKETLTPDEQMLYIITAMRTGHLKEGRDYYKDVEKKTPGVFQATERGRYAAFLIKLPDMTAGERQEFADTWEKDSDQGIKFETLLLKPLLLNADADAAENNAAMETILKQAAEVNRYAGVPLLADYYFSVCRFADAITLTNDYMKHIDSIPLALINAESAVMSGKAELVKSLAESFHKKGSRFKFLARYFDALTAFAGGDNKSMTEAMRDTSSAIRTPLSRLMRLQMALNENAFENIKSTLTEILTQRPFYDLQARARTAVLTYMLRQMQDPKADIGKLAQLAQIMTVPDEDNSFFQRIILTEKYQRNLLKEEEVQAVLKKFTGDPFLINLAAELAVFQGKADEALAYVEQYRALKLEEESTSIDLVHMLSMDMQGKAEEADKEFTKLVDKTEFDLNLLFRYLEFCIRNKRADGLVSMAAKLEKAGDAKLKALAPFFRAEALLLPGKNEEGLTLLAKNNVEHPLFMFQAGNQLCTYDWLDEAAAKYNAVLDTYPQKELVYANLSEVYNAKGDAANALEYARKSWQERPKMLLTGYVYAKRLSEQKRFSEAVGVLKFPRYTVNYPEDVISLWKTAITESIQSEYQDRKLVQAQENCKHLLIYDPGNAVAKDTLARIDTELKKKTEK